MALDCLFGQRDMSRGNGKAKKGRTRSFAMLGAILGALAFLVLFSPAPTASAVTALMWASRAPMPIPNAGAEVTLANNGKLYAIGGGGSCFPCQTVVAYDPATDTWAGKANMPTGRSNVGLASASNGKLYAIGGIRPGFDLATNEEYNPVTDTWAPKASMPTSRNQLAAAAAPNGRIYAIGGNLGSNTLATNEEYDPGTDTWASKASMPTARTALAVAVASNGKLYAVGGQTQPGTVFYATVEEYDPSTDTWSTKASMPTARSFLALVAAGNGKLYAMGGITAMSASPLATVEEFDPATNTWTSATSMPTARFNLGAAVADNGKIYAIGGLDAARNAIATNEEATVVVIVSIDIKPSGDPPAINPTSNGVTPVAILSSSTFDATKVDPSSVTFGPAGASAVHYGTLDVNGDGIPDLMLQFNTQATGIHCGDTSATLTGKTFGGQAIIVTDYFRTVGCK